MDAMVKNAASEKQVSKAKKKESYNRDKYLNDLEVVLSTQEGQRVIWDLLEKCGTFSSIWESSARIHYRSGKQDLGHELMADIAEAGEELLFNLMKNNYNRGEN